jgi:hypothetical protein
MRTRGGPRAEGWRGGGVEGVQLGQYNEVGDFSLKSTEILTYTPVCVRVRECVCLLV